MKPFISLGVLILLTINLLSQNFVKEQRKFKRVENAFTEKRSVIDSILNKNSLSEASLNIFIRILKSEEIVEVWGKDNTHQEYLLLNSYSVCSSSGNPGPKRQQGDGQVPEGFYFIDRFNPTSSFHLSLGLNYPNSSDRVLGEKGKLGGDIFIHGSCVTIGCVPITDDKIKELYALAVISRNNGQKNIPVHIFPCRMNSQKYTEYLKEYPNHATFWNNLKTGFDHFETSKHLPVVIVDKAGLYQFK